MNYTAIKIDTSTEAVLETNNKTGDTLVRLCVAESNIGKALYLDTNGGPILVFEDPTRGEGCSPEDAADALGVPPALVRHHGIKLGYDWRDVATHDTPSDDQARRNKMTFKKEDVIQRIINRCIASKTWRAECEKECAAWLQRGEDRKELETLIRTAYDAAGAGHLGRWQ